MSDKRDLLVLGGGLVGMTLALAAARKGLSSHVVDRADPAELTAEGFDARASAISTASWNLLRNIGLAARLAPHACPIDSIAVTDGMKPGRIDFRPSRTKARSAACSPTASCASRCSRRRQDEPLIAWHPRAEVTSRARGEFSASASSTRRVSARVLLRGPSPFVASRPPSPTEQARTPALMIAAEGRNSRRREEAGSAVSPWD
jgi:2-octaprenyl-6-methoxyphenol hydroxylase